VYLCWHNFLSPYKKPFLNNILLRVNHDARSGKKHFSSPFCKACFITELLQNGDEKCFLPERASWFTLSKILSENGFLYGDKKLCQHKYTIFAIGKKQKSSVISASPAQTFILKAYREAAE